MSYKARLLADWDPSSSLQVCAVTTGQYSFLWISLLLTAQQGSLAQQAVTPCHPDPAAGWNSWNSTTIYKMWNKWISNLVTSLVQVPDKPTQIQLLEIWWVLGTTSILSPPYLCICLLLEIVEGTPQLREYTCTSQQTNSKCWSSNWSWNTATLHQQSSTTGSDVMVSAQIKQHEACISQASSPP